MPSACPRRIQLTWRVLPAGSESESPWRCSMWQKDRTVTRRRGGARRSSLGRRVRVSLSKSLGISFMEPRHEKNLQRCGGMCDFVAVSSSQTLAGRATRFGYAWIWLWLVVGNTPSGKQSYQKLVGLLFEDVKGGLPLLSLALPLLGSAVLSTLVVAARRPEAPPTVGASKRGDPSFDACAVWMLLVPLAIYVLSAVCGRWNAPQSFDERLSSTANSLGLAALVALSLGFVPVARHSVLLQSMGWNPAAAIRLHAWSGRIVVAASILHGGMHLWRFQRLKYSLLHMLEPPAECWVWNPSRSEGAVINGCSVAAEEDCTCYSRWRNAAGAAALAALLVVALSTLNSVRRRWYATFYRIHVLAGPLVLLAVLLHWNRSILYLSAGLVYYLASSLVLVLEERLVKEPVEIVEVQPLPALDPSGSPCVALTVAVTEAALNHFQAGQYVKVCVPSISSLAHPFTINRVPQSPGGSGGCAPPRLRILFRAQGPFTRQLAARLLASPHGTRTTVPVFLDGFHGAGRLHHALRHDWVMVVAGGIGITPYLSLLPDLLEATPSSRDGTGPRTLTVHWICRDPSLIDYVQKAYLDPLVVAQAKRASAGKLQVCIHRTCDRSAARPPLGSSLGGAIGSRSNNDEVNNDVGSASIPEERPQLAPFSPWRRDALTFGGTTVASMVAVWPSYAFAQSHPTSLLPRLLAPLAALLVACTIASASVRLRSRKRQGGGATDPPRGWGRLAEYQSLSSTADDDCLELGWSCSAAASLATDEPGRCTSLVTVEHREGRPSLRGLIDEWLSAAPAGTGGGDDLQSSGGLLVCGPPALGQGLRRALRDHRGCLQRQVAVYEESFEL